MAFIFALVWVLLIGIWAFTGRGLFWPIFPILWMVLALAIQAWNVYGRKPISEEEIRREMNRGDGGGVR